VAEGGKYDVCSRRKAWSRGIQNRRRMKVESLSDRGGNFVLTRRKEQCRGGGGGWFNGFGRARKQESLKKSFPSKKELPKRQKRAYKEKICVIGVSRSRKQDKLWGKNRIKGRRQLGMYANGRPDTWREQGVSKQRGGKSIFEGFGAKRRNVESKGGESQRKRTTGMLADGS